MQTRHLLLIAILSGLLACSVKPLSRRGFLCEEGTCPEGYSCDPTRDVCVTTGETCDGSTRRSPCNPNATDCSIHGCRVCEDGAWTDCVRFRDQCEADTLSCVGDEVWACDGAGRVAEREWCGELGCNPLGQAPHCNACVPGTVRCEGQVRIVCDQFGVPTEENCGAGTTSRCADTRECRPEGCVDVGSAPFGTPCDEGTIADGNFCNSRCDGTGNCLAGQAGCNDGLECTDPDECVPTQGCVVQARAHGSACGDLCNQICDGDGNCIAGAVDCDDDNVCTDDSCDPGQGCQYAGNSQSCDDQDGCTLTDACSGGQCVGSGNPCDDGDPCTIDLCEGGCNTIPVACQPTLGECGVPTSCDPAGAPSNCDVISTDKDGQPCTSCTRPPCSTCRAGVCQNDDRCDGSSSAPWCEESEDCRDKSVCEAAECFITRCRDRRCSNQIPAYPGTSCTSCPAAGTTGCVCNGGTCVDDTGPQTIVVSNLPGFDPCTDTATDVDLSSNVIVDTGIDRSGSSTPTLGGSEYPDNTLIVSQGPGEPEIAVFYFNSFWLHLGVTMTVTGQRALALIACDTIVISGEIVANGQTGGNATDGGGGPGGYAGGLEGSCSQGCDGNSGMGPGGGGAGRHNGSEANEAGGGGGGAYGGDGGDGGYGNATDKDNYGPGGDAAPNPHLVPLHGGSGGGAGGDGESMGTSDARGGGGGGAIQLSANGSIVLGTFASVYAHGGRGADSSMKHGAGGGGSGGGILIEAPRVSSFGVLLDVDGGDGGKNHGVLRAAGATGTRSYGDDGSTGSGGNGGGGGCGQIFVNVDEDDWGNATILVSPYNGSCARYEGTLTYQ